jgi:hypothetical protein
MEAIDGDSPMGNELESHFQPGLLSGYVPFHSISASSAMPWKKKQPEGVVGRADLETLHCVDTTEADTLPVGDLITPIQ